MSNQTCFRCSGLGITYEFEGGFGEKSLKSKWEIHQYVLFAMIQDLQKKK